ncbi:MAG TPA: amidohydrolase family protein [Candidatus Thermoplasmatota archaeon]|nr:amidohydrolase family protein [Candidatus Thermoplasmatota archaeon]
MWVAEGERWEEGGFRRGWVAVEAGRIVDAGRGAAPRAADARGVLMPSLVNAHTHVADRLARGRIPEGISLAAAVEPPHGLKYRLLREAGEEALRASIRAACSEARAAGTRVLYDFREGGVAGTRALREGAAGTGVEPVVLAAPAHGEMPAPGEAEALLALADGFGLSAVRDVTPSFAREHAARARAAGARFAVHWSEGVHEPLDHALDLAPDFLVHAVQATPDDVARIAEARVPIVTCPRSNLRLVRALPDLRAWLDAGIDVCIGSDNAMLQTVSVLDELRFARERLPDVRPEELVAMAVDAPRRRLAPPGAMRAWEPGEPADLVVLEGSGDPWSVVFGGAPRVVHPPAA